MKARRALLRKLASVTDWDAARGLSLEGESWVETRNTLYRFREGVCVAVAGRDPGRSARAASLVGMRLVGWLAPGSAGRSCFVYEWQAGACAVLWKTAADGTDEVMAMTSPTTALRRGRSSAHLQALHDHAPPADSRTFRQGPVSAMRGDAAPRARLPSTPTQPSGSSFKCGPR
jgi:hypothetical protein